MHLSWWVNHNWSTTRSWLLMVTLHSRGLIGMSWPARKHSKVITSSLSMRLMRLRIQVLPIRYVLAWPVFIYLCWYPTWRLMVLINQYKMPAQSTVSAIGVLLFLMTSKVYSQNLMKLASLWPSVDMDLFWPVLIWFGVVNCELSFPISILFSFTLAGPNIHLWFFIFSWSYLAMIKL